jgi:hypothetical protein
MNPPDKTTTAVHGEQGEGTGLGYRTKEPAMTITGTKLTRATGLCAVVAGLLFIGVLGLVGFVLFGAGYLVMLGVEFVGAFVLPALVHSSPGYVDDVLAVATGGTATGDIGLMQTAISVMGITYLGGGFIFGIALFRANVLPRWAAALLAAGTVSAIAISVLPQVNERLFAIPTGVALVGLGYSLWREQHTPAALPVPSPVSPQLDRAGAT